MPPPPPPPSGHATPGVACSGQAGKTGGGGRSVVGLGRWQLESVTSISAEYKICVSFSVLRTICSCGWIWAVGSGGRWLALGGCGGSPPQKGVLFSSGCAAAATASQRGAQPSGRGWARGGTQGFLGSMDDTITFTVRQDRPLTLTREQVTDPCLCPCPHIAPQCLPTNSASSPASSPPGQSLPGWAPKCLAASVAAAHCARTASDGAGCGRAADL